MMRPTLAISMLVLAAGLSAASCRSQPPISGTPMQADESLATGVERQQHTHDQRRSGIIASTEKMAGDIAALLAGVRPEGEVTPIAFAEPVNNTSLPLPGFRGIERQIRDGLRHAGARYALAFVPADHAHGATYLLATQVFDFKSDRSRSFVVDYELRQLSADGSTQVVAAPNGNVVWGKRYHVSMP